MFINNAYAGTENNDLPAKNNQDSKELINNNVNSNVDNRNLKDKDLRNENLQAPNNVKTIKETKQESFIPGGPTSTNQTVQDNVVDDSSATNLSAWASFLPIALMFGVFYLFLIKPQEKRRKEQEDMIKGVQKGESIITAGGIHGIVTRVDDATIDLEIAKDTQIRVLKSAILEIPGRKISRA